MSDRKSLLEMGFEDARVDWALKATKNAGLQPAMDHLLAHSEEPVPDPSAQGAASRNGDMDDEDRAAVTANISQEAEAKSLRCDDCGKQFRNNALASFHAEKSGHTNFSESTEEIKPLTEEEKKAKLEELRAKMAEKRAKQAEQDKVDSRSNELLRRKRGQESISIKEEMKKKELEREAAQRRKEKIEDAKAKAAIKAQIEADKKERAARAAREKALREGRNPDAAEGLSAPAPAAPAKAPAVKGEWKDARLQVRTPGGNLVTTLPADNTLTNLAEYVASQSLDYDVGSITFSTIFPRKTFTDGEMGKTLKELGLVPSAALVVGQK